MPPENDKIFHIKLAKVGGIKYDYIFTVIKAIMHLVELASSISGHMMIWEPGADPGFQVRGAHLKKLRQVEGGAKNFGVFRVKNHDFTPKKSDFFPNAEGSAKIFGVFRVKNHDFTPKNHIYSNFRGGRAPGAPPPLNPPLGTDTVLQR